MPERVRPRKRSLRRACRPDLQRDMVRAGVVSTWGQLDTARAVIQSSKAAVKAAEIALEGIREEAKVGQRTTFDVLFQQQALLNTRVALVTAQRDRVVALLCCDGLDRSSFGRQPQPERRRI